MTQQTWNFPKSCAFNYMERLICFINTTQGLVAERNMQWWGSSENVCHNRNPRGHLVNLFDEGDPYFEEMSKEGNVVGDFEAP